MSDRLTPEQFERCMTNAHVPGNETAIRDHIASIVAERDALRAAIEDYSLWRPGEVGHAAAHRKLLAALERAV